MELFVIFLCSTFYSSYANPGNDNVRHTLVANKESYKAGAYDYYFYDGEPTTFTCLRNSGALVELYSLNGSFVPNSQNTFSVEVYLKLAADLHIGTYVVCNSWTQQKLILQQTVLHLIRMNPENEKEKISFEVNGLILPQMYSQRGHYYYFYTYYHNRLRNHAEKLSIKLLKDSKSHGDIYCSVNGTYVPDDLISRFSASKNVPFTQLDTVLIYGNSNLVLSCPVKYISGNVKRYPQRISLTFTRRDPDSLPFIGCLSMANILMEVKTASGSSVKYEYVSNERLYLTCEFKSEQTLWKYKISDVRVGKTDNEYISWFELKPNVNNTLIECSYPPISKITSLEIVRKRSHVTSPAAAPSDASKVIGGVMVEHPVLVPDPHPPLQREEAQSYPPDMDKPTPGSDPGVPTTVGTGGRRDQTIWIAVAVFVVVLIIIAVILSIAIHQRKRNQRAKYTDTNTEYLNLPQHNEGPMATPAQWDRDDDQTYAVPSKDLYSMPTSKSKRPTEPTYAQAHQFTNCEPAYASVEEKSTRLVEDPNAFGNSEYQNFESIKTSKNLIYAEVAPETSKGERRVLNPRSENYVQIVHKKPEESNYANVDALNL